MVLRGEREVERMVFRGEREWEGKCGKADVLMEKRVEKYAVQIEGVRALFGGERRDLEDIQIEREEETK